MRNGLTRFAWGTLGFNVVVILMGAVVRATGSGAGCGRSWPTCRGQVVPVLEGATAVEFAHRAVSGVALVLVAVLMVSVVRTQPPGHPARGGAVASLVAIIGEALIGAAIVLFEWVAEDASVARAVSVPLHLLNTFVLLAALTLTAYWLGGGAVARPSRHRRTWHWVLAGGAAVLLIAGTGAVTALADTLFPKGGSTSVAAEHFLTDLRIVHPILAVTVAAVAWVAVARRGIESRPVRLMAIVVALQLLSGVLMIGLGVPLWMQIVHLALADLLWITYVLTTVRLLAPEESNLIPAPTAVPPRN
ncbi:MAG: COX15/CtaA family protein [Acidimicrobiia bacterium]